jgi:DNA polymerase gamma 1
MIKVINYGRIYGAGVAYCAQLVRQFNKQLSEQQATEMAKSLYDATKGKRIFRMSPEGLGFFRDIGVDLHNAWFTEGHLRTIANMLGRLRTLGAGTLDDAAHKCALSLASIGKLKGEERWVGGFESTMFNALEWFALGERPRTPVLGAGISSSLHSQNLSSKQVR